MSDGSYSVPTSATIPYGIFEQVLKEKANEGLEEELQEILAEGDMAEARSFLEDELVPRSYTHSEAIIYLFCTCI